MTKKIAELQLTLTKQTQKNIWKYKNVHCLWLLKWIRSALIILNKMSASNVRKQL